MSAVAPRVGAWIETPDLLSGLRSAWSHPVWVRGLKQARCRQEAGAGQSHPVWVRGLKLPAGDGFENAPVVAPRVGAWIETSIPDVRR